MRLMLSIVVAGILAACATPYAPVLDGRPTARIRFVTEHPTSIDGIEAYTRVHYHPGYCSPSARSDAHHNTYDSRSQLIARLTGNTPIFVTQHGATVRLGIPGEPSAKESLYVEAPIAAGQPFRFSMRINYRAQWLARVGCAVGVQFRPEADADYEAVYSRVGEGCAIKLFRLTLAGTSVQKTQIPAAKLPDCS